MAVIGGAMPLAGRKWEAKIDKTEARGAKIEPESMKMRSWVFREASGPPGGSRSAKMELLDNVWVPV